MLCRALIVKQVKFVGFIVKRISVDVFVFHLTFVPSCTRFTHKEETT